MAQKTHLEIGKHQLQARRCVALDRHVLEDASDTARALDGGEGECFIGRGASLAEILGVQQLDKGLARGGVAGVGEGHAQHRDRILQRAQLLEDVG